MLSTISKLRNVLPTSTLPRLAAAIHTSQPKAERLPVHHCEVSNEFYIPLEDVTGNKHKAYVKYDKWEETVTLYRTVVPTVFEGQGIGKVLAKAAFDHCAEKDYKMKITCWYLDGYLKRHPEEKYMKLVVD